MVRETGSRNLFIYKIHSYLWWYTLIFRFSKSTKNTLPSGNSCYSPFHFEVDLVKTERKFWIKMWPETSFVYFFMITYWLQVLCRGKHRHRAKTGFIFWKRKRWKSAKTSPIRKFVICILLRINHLLIRAE